MAPCPIRDLCISLPNTRPALSSHVARISTPGALPLASTLSSIRSWLAKRVCELTFPDVSPALPSTTAPVHTCGESAGFSTPGPAPMGLVGVELPHPAPASATAILQRKRGKPWYILPPSNSALPLGTLTIRFVGHWRACSPRGRLLAAAGVNRSHQGSAAQQRRLPPPTHAAIPVRDTPYSARRA